MDLTVTERRADVRIPGDTLFLVHATLRPGCPVAVIDISRSGLQVEGERALGPGMRVHARLVSIAWTIAATAVVVRSWVSAVRPDAGVTYRSALCFDHRCAHILAPVSI